MTREKYESLPLATLKELAKARKMKGISGMKKRDLIEAMLALDEKEKQKEASEEAKEEVKEEMKEKKEETDIEQLDSGHTANGILEVLQDGYGFIRCENYLPGENDVYVSPSQIRRFGLKTGDIIMGNTRIKTQGEKFSALLYVSTINGMRPFEAMKRKNFEDLTPIFPNRRIRLETQGCSTAMRVVDLVSPIGKGQRGMIVSPPKAGKTTLLKEVALSVQKTEPNMHLLILLIDERPEEVTDIKEAIEGPNVEVIHSTFDELPEHHKRVSEMVIARAKRLVEHGKDVMILLDSITRLARAYNLTVPPSGRTLSEASIRLLFTVRSAFSERRGTCVRAEALRSLRRLWWIREARWMMLSMKSSREPAIWNLSLTGNCRNAESFRQWISRSPEPEEMIFSLIRKSRRLRISCGVQ